MHVEAPQSTVERTVPQSLINFSWAFQEAQIVLGILSQMDDE